MLYFFSWQSPISAAKKLLRAGNICIALVSAPGKTSNARGSCAPSSIYITIGQILRSSHSELQH